MTDAYDSNTRFYDTISRFYDAENLEMTDDLNLYSTLAEQYGGPILDVGSGTGRVMIHLAQEGYDCVGVDSSPEMLARGEQKVSGLPAIAARTRFVYGDIASYEGDEPFRMILLPYHTFMHFQSQELQLAVLRQLAHNLAEGGVIIFDLPNAGEAFATQDEHAISLERTFTHPDTGHVVMQQSVSTIDRVTQVLEITWIYDEIDETGLVHRTIAPLTLRYVFFNELVLLLKLNGLAVLNVYGDYEFGPFFDGCERMIVVAGHADEGS
jgi:SAM-dependent methyltransferase